MRRYGLQPMMVISRDDRLPETTAVLIAMWTWRHRSELAPLFFDLLAMLAGWILHTTHPAWWWTLLLAAAVTAAAVAAFGRRFGLATLAERLYAAVTVIGGGGWLAWATAVGPTQGRLPQVLAVGGLVLAVPWWAHGRRRARVPVERKLAAWPEVASAVGLAGRSGTASAKTRSCSMSTTSPSVT
jgi:S-DNA-T family DNA segregation ATPase FtsK/SpoIIIE